MNRKERRSRAARSGETFETVFDRAVQLMAAARWTEAEPALRLALGIARRPEALHNLGAVLVELGRPGEAVQAYRAALRLSPDEQRTHNSLVKPLIDLGWQEEAVRHGARALELKDREAAVEHERYRPLLAAKESTAPARDLIAFSLWGEARVYVDGALQNLELAARLYPGWTVRIHLDDTVPATAIARLAGGGAEIVRMPRPAADRRYDGLFWRFLAADDPAARHVLFRDGDSLLNERERAAVEAWIASGRTAHVLRDHVLHCELMLAGLWGVVASRLPRLGPAIDAWCRANPHPLNARVQDQTFLRHVVWPLVRDDHLAHDSVYRVFGAGPFPSAEGAPLGVRDVTPRD